MIYFSGSNHPIRWAEIGNIAAESVGTLRLSEKMKGKDFIFPIPPHRVTRLPKTKELVHFFF